MKIVYFTRSLDVGGAEIQLVQTAIAMHRLGHRTSVLSFYGGGLLSARLEEAGVPASDLGKRSRWDLVAPFVRAIRLLRRTQPDVLHSFLTPANIFGIGLKPFLPRTRLVWGIRASHMNWGAFDWSWRVSYGVERFLSYFADAIITNSRAGLRQIDNDGFDVRRAEFIPNGTDTQRFRRRDDRERVRQSLGLAPSTTAVGVVARLDPMKGHDVFLQAAARASRQGNLTFVIVGGEGHVTRASLMTLQDDLGLKDRVVWAGHHHDITGIHSALDVHVSASLGEGFPNSIAEGMACEAVTVATDVGDCRELLGQCGRIVPAGDPQALADAIIELSSMDVVERRALGEAARRRIVDNYSLEAMTAKLLRVYEDTNGL